MPPAKKPAPATGSKTTKAAAAASTKGLSPLARARAALKGVLKEDPTVPLTDSVLRKSMDHLPTGSIVVDYLIGGRPNKFGIAPCPGIPRGRITNVYGNAGAGKTTLALTAAATTCANGGTCVYIDWENEVDPRYAAALGVPIHDASRFILMQPETLEQGMKIMVQMATEGVDLIVVDSVAAGVPEDLYNRAIEEEGNQSRIGLVAQKWSQFLPKFKTLISKSGTAVIGISQLRKKIATGGGGHGPDTDVQGGEAWKFYSAVRMMLRVFQKEKGKSFNAMTGKIEEQVSGTIVIAKLDKCKVSDSVHHEQKFYLASGSGIDNARSVVDLAISYKIVMKNGSWLEWPGAPDGLMKAQGKDGLLKMIGGHPSALRNLFAQVVPKLGAPGAEAVAEAQFADEDEDGADDLFEGMVPSSGPAKKQDGEEEPDLSDVVVEDEEENA